MLVDVANLMISSNPTIVILVKTGVPYVERVRVIFVVGVVFGHYPRVVVPVLNACPIVLVGLMCFIFRYVPKVGVRVFRLFCVAYAVRCVGDRFKDERPGVAIRASAVRVVIHVVDVCFSLGEVVVQAFRRCVGSDPSCVVLK